MTPDNPARWAPDPLGRHQYRYWDGSQWTDHVSDDGVVQSDPPVVGPPAAAAASAGAADPVARNGGFGATHLGAPMPGTGASAFSPGAPATTYDPTAVLGRRYGAFLIDAVVCLVVFGALFFATASTHTRAEMLRVPGCHLSATDSSQVECDNRAVVTVNDTVYETEFGLFAGLSVVFTLLYFAVVEAITGASLGKHLTGLRVVTPEGARPGFGRSLARWALFAVDGPLSLFLCGIITAAVSSGHRRLGDMGANTYVVARTDAGRPLEAR
jgi:hypothetical protein